MRIAKAVGSIRNWSKTKKIAGCILLLLPILFYFSLPNIEDNYSTVLYDSQNKLLGARIAGDGQWRFPKNDSIPDKFGQCIIQFEDQYFNYHPGVNIVSLFKAFYFNVTRKGKKIGGSTITMQLVRIAKKNPERTYVEKIIEIFLALRIESSYSKNEILNLYASYAPFGGNVVGLNAASWRYFGRDPFSLSWGESALLAVLPNAPSLIYPGKNHERLLKKRDRLLRQLFTNGIIDKNTYDLSLKEQLPEKPLPIPMLTPHLLQRAAVEHGEGKVYKTTLVKEIQERTVYLLEKHVSQLKSNQINNACAIVIDTKTGNVLAYVGNSNSADKKDHNDVDIISAARSSGSILKPILYALLVSEGKMAPHAFVEDVPVQIGSYAPKNFNLTFDGMVPASQALERSMNVPAIKMLQAYGNPSFLYQLKKIGFTTINKPADHYGLSLILGGAEVSPWDIASVYSYLGRSLITYNENGVYNSNDLHNVNYLIQDQPLNQNWVSNSTISAGSLWTTFKAMTELARPTDYTGSSVFSSLSRIAWKTGTSFGFRDAWAIGLNQKYTVVVWAGNADGEGRPGLTGINAAAPLMFSIFNMLQGQQWFNRPSGDLVTLKMCKVTGNRASENCEEIINTEVPKMTVKSPLCTLHKLIHTDSSSRYQVSSMCYPVSAMKHKPYLLLSPLQEYFYKMHHPDYPSLPPYKPGCTEDTSIPKFDLVYPRNGFRIYLPVDENGQRSQLIMNATHRIANATLFWYLDKEFIGETSHYHQMAVSPQKGKHRLEVFEEKGNGVKVNFEIVDKEKSLTPKQ